MSRTEDLERMLAENYPAMPAAQRRATAVYCGFGTWQWRDYYEGIVYLSRPVTFEAMEGATIDANGKMEAR
jgi:hypothetical protein